MTRIFIVRHGNTFLPGQQPRRIGARTDTPLTPEGRTQAEAVGRWLAKHRVRFSRALAGPLQRTWDTASIILSQVERSPAIEKADWLIEIDHGPDEDEDEAAVIGRLGPAALAAWDNEAIVPPGWLVDVPARTMAWRTYLTTATDGDHLLVTSNGAARFALTAHPELRLPGSLKIRTCAMAVIGRASDGTLSTAAWDVQPWGDQLNRLDLGASGRSPQPSRKA